MKLSPEAVEYAEDNCIDVDIEDLEKFILEALNQPGDATFWDEELYDTHTLAFHTPAWNLTVDDILGQANYRSALDILEPLGAEAATVGHWTYSQLECIRVPLLTEDGAITAAAVELWDLSNSLEDFGVIDENTYYELQSEVDERAMNDAIDWEERQREITFDDDQKQLIAEIYWENYYGYHESGYVEDELFQKVVDDVLSGDYQRHQETKLW